MEQAMERTRMKLGRRRHLVFSCAAGIAFVSMGCAAGKAPAPPPACEQDCQDNIALRGLRETMRFLYNQHLQGKPVGMQDAMGPCPLGVGTIHIFGNAESDATLGITTIDSLTYDFQNCVTRSVNATPERNYMLALTGSVIEKGLLVMSTGTSALTFESSAMTWAGTVYHPAVDYNQSDCELKAHQDGNNVSGTICGRPAGFTF